MLILKLDFEKAFDKVEHQFILQLMEHKGFGSKWLMWMKMIFNSGTSSILLNGVLGKVFHCKRGVRQGDPLSPLLFVRAADILQSLINQAMNQGLLTLPLPTGVGSDFPIIQYADDTLIILEACETQLNHLKGILDSFAHSAGLKVNFSNLSWCPLISLRNDFSHLQILLVAPLEASHLPTWACL